MSTWIYLGPSVSTDDNCTSHCDNKNLICSAEFTEIDVKNINCNKSAEDKWSQDYHPSYDERTRTCKGFKETNTQRACDKVNTSSYVSRICFCLRPGKEFLKKQTGIFFHFQRVEVRLRFTSLLNK